MITTWTKRHCIFTLLITLLAGSALGCGEEAPPPPPKNYEYTLEVEVTDTDENPLPRIPVTLDGKVVGKTDKEGKFAGTLHELPGTEVTLGVQDIEGYRFVNEDETSVTETLKTTTVNGKKSGVPLFLQIQAESITKDYLVWVQAKCDDTLEGKCEGLPLLFGDEEVARTNALGFAHFSFSDVPQNDVALKIDTPDGDETFEPADPEYALTLDLDSHIYLIDETFTNPDAEPKARPRRRRAKRRSAKRSRKSSPKRKKKKKSGKKEEKGVIDLW
jgi:hypothetical protein